MSVHLHKAQRCPHCGHRLNASSNAASDPAAPVEGDYTLCVRCHEVLVFGPELQLRVPKLVELERLDPETLKDIATARAVLRSVRGDADGC